MTHSSHDKQTELLDNFLFKVCMIKHDRHDSIQEKKNNFLEESSYTIQQLDLKHCIKLYNQYITAFNERSVFSDFNFVYTHSLSMSRTCYLYMFKNLQPNSGYTRTHKQFLGLIKQNLLCYMLKKLLSDNLLDQDHLTDINLMKPVLQIKRGQYPNLFVKLGLNKGYQGQFNKMQQLITKRYHYCNTKTLLKQSYFLKL